MAMWENSVNTYGLTRRLVVAFALGFVLPSLVFIYLWDKVNSESYTLLFLSTILGIGLGFYYIWGMVQRMLDISVQAKNLSQHKSSKGLDCGRSSDELGELGMAIQSIASNMEQKMQDLQKTAQSLEQTKKALSDTTLYADSIIRSMADTMIVVDRDLRITSVNRAACELLGFNEEDLKTKEIHFLVDSSSEEDSLFLEELKGLEKGNGMLHRKKAVFLSKSGERVPVDTNVSLLRYGEGEISGSVIIARDVRKVLGLISELEQANHSLEEKIKERTADIERAYQELKSKDAQILNQEKMASIGLLAAGIAHEINNPIGFINSNLDVLGEYVADIETFTRHLERGAQSLRDLHIPQEGIAVLDEASRLKEELKVEEVFLDLGNLLNESKGGIGRVKKIVSDLRNFSHADENKVEEANLNEGIESTLSIVWNEIKYRTKVIKSYGNLPLIRCYPQQLNQVFMNLLVNAAQAIETKGEIRITTHHDAEHVYVEISDAGTGISPENLKHIFEPFFTTKGVGKGTGLGLSIVYSIIEKHKGDIQVKSTLGKGTTFTIKLPINTKEEGDEGADNSHCG